MIAVSGLLVLIAFVTLVLGIFQSGLTMIWVSIASSVLAAISLASGVVKTRPKAVAVGPEPLGSWSPTSGDSVADAPAEPAAFETPPVTAVLSLDEPETPGAEPEEAPASRARKAPAKKAAAAKKTASAGRASGGTVVVIPGRDKFHKATCRYAKGEATQTIAKATAKKDGYVACGVCKP